jgi:hypothetical protein
MLKEIYNDTTKYKERINIRNEFFTDELAE